MKQQQTQQTQQRSLTWYRDRLGKLTGSRLGDIMKTGRRKGETFGDVAKSYLYQVAAERTMARRWVEDDDRFQSYVELISVTSKAIEWGIEMEALAIQEFEQSMGFKVQPATSMPMPGLPYFASSPDGIIRQGPVEVKCPSQSTFMKYAAEIHDAETLKSVKPEYYWQCVAHMLCTGSEACFFIVYCPWQDRPLHTTVIKAIPEDLELATDRIRMAEKFIQELIDGH